MATYQVQDSEDPRQYPIPVYLNQKYCFDLLAMMENGFAQLETIRTTESEQGTGATRFSGDVGLRDAFAFVGIKLGGERSMQNQNTQASESTVERVHTPNSLFAKVRQRLHDGNVVRWSELSDVAPGDFVEFSASLRRSPLLDALGGDEISRRTCSGY